MDRYLFRGFHKDENGTETIYLNGEEIKGNWVYGYYVKVKNGYTKNSSFNKPIGEYIIAENNELIEVIPETVGQWSGLENQYHQKIFEHDILREYSNEIEDWVVSYEYGKFVGTSNNVSEDLWEIHDMEVVGNIFDEWWNI